MTNPHGFKIGVSKCYLRKDGIWHITIDKVKYCLLEQIDWHEYPTFNTIEEAYEHKYILESEKPEVYMLDPISVVVFGDFTYE
jgi:hypothetical protein|tara:strand:- start:55 stop:303 length:249 start_codon:yes stop_codon:yes gene_type:complete